ncbi:MAG: acyl-CoA thioesterase [Rhodospirillales bacterium]|nr:acyl-CoA thioesterase [Rhodospirillales bacterium]MYE19771.1 acyl-CoA thioesterase [Rhodospirillales bacterium]
MNTAAPEPRALRAHYPYWRELQTRWGDNDIYGHMNNVVHYQLFDTVVNRFYAEDAGWNPATSEAIGITPETRCRYFKQLRYPDPVDAGVRAAHVGRKSLVFDIGLFRRGDPDPAAIGYFVHVFVARERQEQTVAVPAGILAAVQRLMAGADGAGQEPGAGPTASVRQTAG